MAHGMGGAGTGLGMQAKACTITSRRRPMDCKHSCPSKFTAGSCPNIAVARSSYCFFLRFVWHTALKMTNQPSLAVQCSSSSCL